MNRRGSTSWAVFVVLLLLGMGFFALYFLNLRDERDRRDRPAAVEAALSPEDRRLHEIEEGIVRLSGSLADAESIRDSKTYLAVLADAEKLIAESDAIWDRRLNEKAGTVAGIMSGMGEYFESHFTTEEKIEMLAEKYGLPPEKIVSLKADLEMAFWDEWGEKFGGQAG